VQRRAILLLGWRVLEFSESDSVGDGAVDLMFDVASERRLESRSPSVGAGAMFFRSDMLLTVV